MMRHSACAFVLGLLIEPAGAGEIGGGFSSFVTHEKNIVASTARATLSDVDELSEPASEFVSGTIDAFLGHSQVSGQEKKCLSRGAGDLASSLTESFAQAMDSYKSFAQQATATQAAPAYAFQQPGVAGTPIPALMPMTGTLAPPTSTPMMQLVPPVPVASAMAPSAVTEGEKAVVGMELAASLSNLYRMQKDLAKSCLKRDMLNEFATASENIGNMTFVGGRLVANGADILEELSNALSSYEHHNYREFGKNMGAAWRKVALSQRANSDLSEPAPEAIEDVTQGLVFGFFGSGFKLQVMTDSAPLRDVPTSAVVQQSVPPAAITDTLMPAAGVSTSMIPISASRVLPSSTTAIPTIPVTIPSEVPPSYPPINMNVDLHTCIKENLPLLKSAWAPVFDLAEAAAGSTVEAPMASDMMMSLMDVQLALKQCNIGPAQEAMLVDAWEGGGDLKAKLSVPNENVKTASVAKLLASAMEDYKDHQYYEFGKQLGKALQDMVIVTFPLKYEVDESGKLRNAILGASELDISSTQYSQSPVLYIFIVASATFMFVASLIILRSRQTILQMIHGSSSGVIIEDQWSDLEAVE